MFLVATTNTLEAVLDAAPSAQWPIIISYADLTATAFNGGQQVTNTNGTTPVTVLAAPAASTVRQVKTINAYNAGNADRTLTIRLDVSGTESILWSGIVPVGKTLTWNADKGWSLGDTALSASNITFTPTGNVAATNVQNAIAEVDSEKVAKAGDTMTGVLNINLNTIAFPAPLSGTVFHVGAADGLATRFFADAFANGCAITGRRANGTNAAKTALLLNDPIFTINGVGYGATGYSSAQRAAVQFRATENWSDTAQGASAAVLTTPNGTAGAITRWHFDNDGSLRYEGGTATGASTINAVNYFDDGVNINTIYGSLALANTWTQAQTINGNTPSPPAPLSGTLLHVLGADSSPTRFLFDGFGTATGQVCFRRARGTKAAPSALQLGDAIASIATFGYGATAYTTTGRANITSLANENWTDTAQGTRWEISATPNGSAVAALLATFTGGGGLSMLGTLDAGSGTINAVNYFDDGVNINTIYAGLAAANVFTSLNTFRSTTPGIGGVLANANFLIEATAAGVQGPNFVVRSVNATPAAADIISKYLSWGKNSAAADYRYSLIQTTLDDPTAGSEDATIAFATSVAGAFAFRLLISNGVVASGALGGDQGLGTINAQALYTNGQLVADTNGLIRSRVYTFGTLPAAAGVTGARAQITDGAAAPVWNAAAAGGGAVNTPVRSTGAAWVNG